MSVDKPRKQSALKVESKVLKLVKIEQKNRSHIWKLQ